jgi:hypothetical protein
MNIFIFPIIVEMCRIYLFILGVSAPHMNPLLSLVKEIEIELLMLLIIPNYAKMQKNLEEGGMYPFPNFQ